MIYIENAFICLAAPLVVAALCVGKANSRVFVFLIIGGLSCLLSAYVNTFVMGATGSDMITAMSEISPVVEETMKIMPAVFYLIVFEPRLESARLAVFAISAGFATFENTCYLIEHGAQSLQFLLVRGLSAGAMHIVCGALTCYGIIYVWKKQYLKIAGTFGMLCAAITYHAVYNLLVSADGVLYGIGLAMPLVTVIVGFAVFRAIQSSKSRATAQ